MSTNVTAFIKRRTVETAAELKAGEYQLERGQWGYATMDDRAILRDLEGRFHELMVESEAVPLMDELILTNAPVSLFADLPAGDPPGSMRLVSSEIALYVRGLAGWIKQPTDSIYADFIGIGAIDVTITMAGDGEVPIGTISHKYTDGFRHIPATKASITPERVIIGGRTYNTVNTHNATWLAEDLDINVGQGTDPYGTHRFFPAWENMLAADSIHPDWRVPTLADWNEIITVSSNPAATLANREMTCILGDSHAWGDSEHQGSSWPESIGGQNLNYGNKNASGMNISYLSDDYPKSFYWSSQTCKDDFGAAMYGDTNFPLGFGYPGSIRNAPGKWYNGYWYPCYHTYAIAVFYKGWYMVPIHPAQGGGGVPPGNASFGLPPPGNAYQPMPFPTRIRLRKKRFDSGSNNGKCLIAKTDLAVSEKWDFPNMDMIAQGSASKKLTATEYTDLTDLGDSALHHHVSDGGYSVDVIYSQDFMYAHGWGRNPSVELIDTMGRHVWIEVGYPDANTVQILCNQPFTGQMRLT